MGGDIKRRGQYPTPLVFALLFFALVGLHFSLLRLAYFWDEAGYYIPAARDLLLQGTFIPYSTPSNAHPPLVTAYLALAWRFLGYTPLVTRTAMLAVAAFALLGVFRLAQRVANAEVAIASTICTAIYPVFFAQSSLAHLDLAAAAFTFWGLLAYVERRPWGMVLWFSLAVLAKETAILAPCALFAWDLLGTQLKLDPALATTLIPDKAPLVFPSGDKNDRVKAASSLLLLPIIPLALWYAFHHSRTGFVFGNPEFFRYNVRATMQPLRVLLALGLRLWQVLGYLNLYFLTAAAILALWLPPLRDNGKQRERIPLDTQLSFLAVTTAYVAVMAVVGGAVLARYMLPVVPLVIIICVSTLRRRARLWRGIIAVVVLAFVAALFVNPPHGFSIEDNLAYRDYILLHQRAEEFVEARYPMSKVLTAWPASDELTRPYLGYVTRPMRVLRIEDFSAMQIVAAAHLGSDFDLALVFSTKYEPPHPWLERWRKWQQWKTEFFGYHRDVPPAVAAQVLGGRLVYTDSRHGQWIGVIEMERIQEARVQTHGARQ